MLTGAPPRATLTKRVTPSYMAWNPNGVYKQTYCPITPWGLKKDSDQIILLQALSYIHEDDDFNNKNINVIALRAQYKQSRRSKWRNSTNKSPLPSLERHVDSQARSRPWATCGT